MSESPQSARQHKAPGVSPGNSAQELPSPRSGRQILGSPFSREYFILSHEIEHKNDSRTAVPHSAGWVSQLYSCPCKGLCHRCNADFQAGKGDLPQKSSLEQIGTETCRRHVIFIESPPPSHFFRKERNAKAFRSLRRLIRCSRIAINISPLRGDDSVILQRTNRNDFEAKPGKGDSYRGKLWVTVGIISTALNRCSAGSVIFGGRLTNVSPQGCERE